MNNTNSTFANTNPAPKYGVRTGVGCIVENPGVFFSIFLTDQSSMFAVHIIGMLVKDLRLSSLSERGYPDNTANSFLVCLYILEENK
jgi:hypothetical protein